jgi:hypothetical protein
MPLITHERMVEMKSRMWFLCVVLGVGLLDQAQAVSDRSTLIVMPARYRVVGFIADVSRLTGSSLVSYQVVMDQPKIDVQQLARSNVVAYAPATTPPEIVLHVWSGSQWVALSMEKYREGLFLNNIPKRIVLVGSKKDLPESLVDASSWAPDVTTFDTLDLAPLTSQFDALFHFTPQQLKWLAQRHDLQLVDTSVERRHYGRYGKPGERPLWPFGRRKSADMPPAAEKPSGKESKAEVVPAADVEIPLPADK